MDCLKHLSAGPAALSESGSSCAEPLDVPTGADPWTTGSAPCAACYGRHHMGVDPHYAASSTVPPLPSPGLCRCPRSLHLLPSSSVGLTLACCAAAALCRLPV